MARSVTPSSQSDRLKKMRDESSAAISSLTGLSQKDLDSFIAAGDQHPAAESDQRAGASGSPEKAGTKVTRSKKAEDKIMVRFPLRLPPSMLVSLKTMAGEEERDVADIIREAIREHLRAQYI